MAKKKTVKKTAYKPKYAPGEATCGTLEKPEGWSDKLFKTWLAQRSLLARRMVLNEARANPFTFKDENGFVPSLEPLPPPYCPGQPAINDRSQVWYDKQVKERQEWLERIKQRDKEEGERQAARIKLLKQEREERERLEHEGVRKRIESA